jgi:hypothetical protein
MTQSPERDQSEVLSIVEHRMDSLLIDFFRAEVPPNLNNALAANVSVHSVPAPVSLQIAGSQLDLNRFSGNKSSAGRFAVLTSLALLLICALLLPTETGPLRDRAKPASSELLPVSSEAGIPAAAGHIIGPNGLTIEETDGFEFRPDSPTSGSEPATESKQASPRSK